MPPQDSPRLDVDEGLFLQATRTLAEQEERFELLTVVRTYTREKYVAAHFAVEVGRDLGNAERAAIENYVAAVYLTHSHHGSIEDIEEIREDFDGPALDFIRSAAWSFLTAWTLRYGGLYARHVVRNTLVDPTVDNP